ncbi:hypothetical protein C826_01187 [Helicobacter bilis WiWa]|uniref:P-type conjugative transfer protein TrbJ n=5 Tax=Helicobacter bilis TaxID=37372 RepID=N2BG94_9HELI|nr:hypothetical protein [Helicobacter bilis]EMZ39211.1 hypothetical protein C826_01187 [Helicobacter bilis WiWa]
MKISLKSIVLASLLSLTPAYSNMPVFDFSNLTQAIMEYQEQIKEMIMFEKQLEEMGIDVDRISGFINEIQGAWDSIQNLNEQALNLSGIESLLDGIKSDCDILQEASDTFKDFINEQKKKLKGMDSTLALKQACMNALANEEFTKEVSNKYQNKAKEYLKNGDMDNYRKEIVKAKEVEDKRKQNIAKTQNESVNKVLNSYNLYTEGSASNGSKYNMLYRKDTQEMMSKIQKQLSDTKIRTMNDKEKQEALLRTQSMILQVLVSQYEVMQNMNAKI